MADEAATKDIERRQPIQCALWENPALALGKFSKTFELVEEYVMTVPRVRSALFSGMVRTNRLGKERASGLVQGRPA